MDIDSFDFSNLNGSAHGDLRDVTLTNLGTIPGLQAIGYSRALKGNETALVSSVALGQGQNAVHFDNSGQAVLNRNYYGEAIAVRQ